jgi:hypothetical protein
MTVTHRIDRLTRTGPDFEGLSCCQDSRDPPFRVCETCRRSNLLAAKVPPRGKSHAYVERTDRPQCASACVYFGMSMRSAVATTCCAATLTWSPCTPSTGGGPRCQPRRQAWDPLAPQRCRETAGSGGRPGHPASADRVRTRRHERDCSGYALLCWTPPDEPQ